MKSIVIGCAVIAVACLGLTACTSGSKYETAPYRVTRSDGPFENRTLETQPTRCLIKK